jgi:hypothetical protein
MNRSEFSSGYLTELEEEMFASFQTLSRSEQIRKIMIAGNAEFVIRMLQNTKSVHPIVEALTRYVRT